MFAFADAAGSLRPELRLALVATWEHLARPGTWWAGSERGSLAEVARRARCRLPVPDNGDLPDAAIEAATLLASEPARTTQEWVGRMIAELGEEPFVELLGIVTRVVAIDTFTRLLGFDLEPFPDPHAGEPVRVLAEPRPSRIRSWVAVGNALVPPFTLSLVPAENQVTNSLVETLYMTGADMEDPDFRRGDLHRTQIELVAATLSYQNECFY